jgi:hypothetical protein
MSKLERFLKEYADNAGIVLKEQDVAVDPTMMGDPMGGMGAPAQAVGASTVANKTAAKKKAEEFISADEIVEFTQNIKDALGIDPSTLSAAQKGEAFAEDITPENAEVQLAILRDLIAQKTNPSEVETD